MISTLTLEITSAVTKADVLNNKILVRELSYGRSFFMAVDGCWDPMCEFTGTRTKSDANPGRCTDVGGYIANPEINEIVQNGRGELHYDDDSDTNVLIYDGS